jgi:hypothetical protein
MEVIKNLVIPENVKLNILKLVKRNGKRGTTWKEIYDVLTKSLTFEFLTEDVMNFVKESIVAQVMEMYEFSGIFGAERSKEPYSGPSLALVTFICALKLSDDKHDKLVELIAEEILPSFRDGYRQGVSDCFNALEKSSDEHPNNYN